jgi:hypothetical protein
MFLEVQSGEHPRLLALRVDLPAKKSTRVNCILCDRVAQRTYHHVSLYEANDARHTRKMWLRE